MDLLDQIKSLHWGMLKPDYQKIFLDKNWQPKHPTDNALIFGDTCLSHPVFVVAHFFDGTDKLGRLIFGCNNLSDDELKKVYRKIINDLTEKYGESQFSETSEDGLSEMKKWKTKDSIISSNFMLSKSSALSEFNAFNISSGFDAAHPGIEVIWGDIKNDPLSKRWDESGFSDENKPQKLPKDFMLSDAQIEEIRKSME